MNPERLEQLTARLIKSYEDHPTRPDQGEPLPSLEAITEVMEEVRRLIFPGFYAAEHLSPTSRPYRVGHWIARLHQRLTQVLTLALAHEHARSHGASRSAEASVELCERAETLCAQLLDELPTLRHQLVLDAQAALDGDPAASNLEEIILTYPGFEAITTHRFAHLLYQEKIPYLPRALSEHAHARTGIDIHPGAQIGESFFIDHGTGVVIGESTVIGDRVKVYQGVTLGALSVRREFCGHKRHPTIEDDVVIYAGATVLGGDTVIGAGSVIGGNVWIIESIPPQSSVIGKPPSFRMRDKVSATR